MSEFIPPTPEGESESRHMWDRVIRAYVAMSELDDNLDLYWVLDNLKDEDEQAAYDELFGNYIMLTVPEGSSDNLAQVEEFLRAAGILEEDNDEI